MSQPSDRDTASSSRRFVTRVGQDSTVEVPAESVRTFSASQKRAMKALSIGSALVGVAMLAGSVALGTVQGPAEVSEADDQKAFELRQDIRTAEGREDALPSPADTQRRLVTAFTAATDVAELQNDYRALTPAIAAAGGVLEDDVVYNTRRDLSPYFGTMTDSAITDPWYLLEADGRLSSGSGLSMTFPSGFEWVAQTPYGIDVDSRVGVVWLAQETRPAEGESPQILAFARADYDITRQVFVDVLVGTTGLGEQVRQEVTP